MSHRERLTELAEQWISLWCVPVDWDLFDRLHGDVFEDCAAAGRAATRDGFAQGLHDFTRAFPDLEARVEDLVTELS